MRCIWSGKAPGTLRSCNVKRFCTVLKSCPSQRDLPRTGLANRKFATSSAALLRSTKSLVELEDAMNVPESAIAQGPLTPAAQARAAAKAARLFLMLGKLDHAVQIFNAARYSACPPGSRAPPGAIHEDIAEAHFSQKVSPVLPAHTLLHHFIREHDVSRAHDLATSMMKEGIRLHGRSLRALVRVATQPGPTPFTLLYKSYKSARSGFKPLDLSNARSRDPNTNFALSLMRTAREAQYKHTDEILAQIIKLCTFNGELCLAGMIFAAVIIDWQRRKALAAQLQSGIEHMQDDQPPPPPSQQERPNSLRRGAYLSPNMPWIQLVTSIEHVLSTERETEQWDDVQAEALQTLTILAELLDNQAFPYRNVAPLLRALYRCPKTKRKVWIRNKDGSYRKVVAYQYFHEVLLRFIGDLPTKRPPIPDVLPTKSPPPVLPPQLTGKTICPPSSAQSRFMSMSAISRPSGRPMPQLDLASYNTLLHYTLRHWLSTDLASSVLTHMTQVRNPPLNPDRVTLNILLSCGTKLRRNDVVQQGFDVLGDTQENTVEHIVDGAIAKVRYLKQHALEGVTSMVPPPTGDLSPRSTRSIAPVVDADMRTIVALMTHLTSSGNPHGAVHVLLRFLPELSSTDPPSWDSLPSEEKTRRRGIARQECVQRAKLLGPHFFVAALNALVKSGRSGLAERVWFLAKSAETASGHAWILPTEAYTIMVQCYGAEARKFAMACFQKPVPRLASTGKARASLDRSSEEWYQWVPRTQRHVVGWASFLGAAAGSRQEPLLRSEAGYRIAALFYEFIARKVRGVRDALVLQDDLPQHVHPPLPRPDAKFFNAALKVFSHRLLTRASQAMRSGETWPRDADDVRKLWPAELQIVLEDLAAAGYDVPPGFLLFLRILRERDVPVPSKRRRKHTGERPYAFPSKQSWDDFQIPVVKTKGLPIRRRSRLPQQN